MAPARLCESIPPGSRHFCGPGVWTAGDSFADDDLCVTCVVLGEPA